MKFDQSTLLHCAYAIACFDLLCAVLFFCYSFSTFCVHVSWLTIFGVCFGLFWLTLIVTLVSGIYWRRPGLIGYWLLFSCLGIIVEALLIVYAFLKNSTFNAGLINNSFFLGLALIVECCFAFIIYEFYRTLKADPCRCDVPEMRSQRDPCVSYISASTTTHTASMQPRCQKAPRERPRCSLLQGEGPDSPYTCGPRRKPD